MNYNTIKVVDGNGYSTKIKAITHAGVFHADEVFSTAILAEIFLKEDNVYIMRTFNIPDKVDVDGDMPIVYDIGGGKYDHHQMDKLRPNDIPYSSAGLIWKDYGEEFIRIQLKNHGVTDPKQDTVDGIWKSVDRNLFQYIDARDNGVDLTNNKDIHMYTVADMISAYNPNWDDYSDENYCFEEAVWFSLKTLKRIVERSISIYKGKAEIDHAISISTNGVMVLPVFIPWQSNLFNSEEEKAKDINWAVFPSKRGGWNIQTVPITPGNKEHRRDFPKEWWGHPEMTGVSRCSFIHASGFMASCYSIEDCKELARRADEHIKVLES